MKCNKLTTVRLSPQGICTTCLVSDAAKKMPTRVICRACGEFEATREGLCSGCFARTVAQINDYQKQALKYPIKLEKPKRERLPQFNDGILSLTAALYFVIYRPESWDRLNDDFDTATKDEDTVLWKVYRTMSAAERYIERSKQYSDADENGFTVIETCLLDIMNDVTTIKGQKKSRAEVVVNPQEPRRKFRF